MRTLRTIVLRLALRRARSRQITAMEAHRLDRRRQALSPAYGGRATRIS